MAYQVLDDLRRKGFLKHDGIIDDVRCIFL